MTFEDNILAYLDGTLGEEESAELLHSLSISPERRALLEEHLRMKDVVGLGQRPFSVPASVERALAERLPILAREEPQVAAPLMTYAPTTGFFMGFVQSIQSFIGTHALSTSLSFGAILVVAGLIWFAPVKDATISTSNSLDDRSSAQSLFGESGRVNRPSSTDESTTLKSQNTSSAKVSQLRTRTHIASLPAVSSNSVLRTTSLPHEHTDGSSIRNHAAKNLVSNDVSNPVGNSVSNISAHAPEVAEDGSSAHDDSSVPNHLTSTAIRTTIAEIASIQPIMTEPAIFEPENDHKRWTLGVGYGSYQYQMPKGGVLDSTNQSIVSQPEIFVALDLSSHFSLGLEAGRMEYATVSNVVSQRSLAVGGYTQFAYLSVIRSALANWSRVMLRYTLNPEADYRIHAAASGGLAFQGQTSPNVGLSLGIAHTLVAGFDFDASLNGFGTWSVLNSAQGLSQLPLTSSTVGIVRSEAIDQNIFTPAFGIKAGLSYRF